MNPGRKDAPGGPAHEADDALVGCLLVHDGQHMRGSYELRPGSWTLGREEDCHFAIPDARVSRHHCAVDVSHAGCQLRDLNSRNGTFVNGEKIERCWLQSGDRIALGSWTLEYQEAPAHPTAPQDVTELIRLSAEDDGPRAVNLTLPRDQADQLFSALGRPAAAHAASPELLATLYAVGQAIMSLRSLDELLAKLLDLVFEVLPVDRGFVLLVDDGSDELRPAAARNDVGGQAERVTLSRTIATQVLRDNVSVLTEDASRDDRFKAGESVVFYGIRSAMCVPLTSPNRVHGIFYVDTRYDSGAYTADHLKLLTTIGRQAGVAIENVRLYEEQKRSFESLIETLAATIDARDPATAGHSQRVAEYAGGIARTLGLTPTEQEVIRYAAFLHDYGKIGVRDALLQKPDKLTPDEYHEAQQHAAHTARILSKIRFGGPYREIPRIASAHHERLDGAGYPAGLRGPDIPLGARIIAVADVFDAIRAERYYKPACTVEEAYAVLDAAKGSHLDPAVVEAFKRYHRALSPPAEPRDPGGPHR